MKPRPKIAFCGIVVGAVALAAFARAAADGGPPTDSQIADARVHYRRALDLARSGSAAEACVEFRRAYEIAPSFKLLGDLSECHERDGDFVGATRRLEELLAEAGDALPPERRVEVSTRLAALRARLATIVVTTNVSPVDILVDGSPQTAVPNEAFSVNPGRHKIWATKSGYYPASKEIVVASSESAKVDLQLRAMDDGVSRAKPRRWRWPAALGACALVFVVIGTILFVRRRRTRVDSVRHVPRLDAFGSSRDEPVAAPTRDQTRVIVCDSDALVDAEHEAPSALPIRSGGETDIGRVKPTNQDAFLVDDAKHVYVVADGIGGYAGGEIASATAVETLRTELARKAIDIGELTHLPRAAAELAAATFAGNRAIRRRAAADWNVADMGTTCVALRFTNGNRRVCAVHIGDSRAYRFREGKLVLLTTDHTMENLGAVGVRSSQLAAALGSSDRPQLDVLLATARPRDVFLLCSDGLSKMVTNDAIAQVLASTPTPGEAARRLVASANEAGGKDNVTAVVIALGDG